MADRRASRFHGGGNNLTVQQVVALGTGAVTTQTRIVGSVPQNARLVGIRFYGQAAVTGTTLTAEVFARTAAGAAGVTLQSAATDIKFASAAAAKTGVAASLTATASDLRPAENQLLEVVFTATAITVGPDDLLVEIDYEPRI